MKKILMLGLAVFALFVLGACQKDISATEELNVAENYALGAITSSNMLSTAKSPLRQQISRVNAFDNVDDQQGKDLEVVTNHLNDFENLLNDHAKTTIVLLNSDKAEFAIKIKYTSNAITGIETTYILYLNEEVIAEKNQNKPNKSFAKMKTDTKITGFLVTVENGVTVEYSISGKKEVKVKETSKEKEYEIEMEITAKKDDLNYVKTNYEFETESDAEEFEQEASWQYVMYEKGQKVRESKIQTEEEIEANEIEKSVKLEIIEYVDGKKVKTETYKFKTEVEDGKEENKFYFEIDDNGVKTKGHAKYELILKDDVEVYKYRLKLDGMNEKTYYVSKADAKVIGIDPTPSVTDKKAL